MPRFFKFIIPSFLFLFFPYVSHAIQEDSTTAAFRAIPKNGPVNSAVESWTILAPGTGGIKAQTCKMCTDQMHLYDDLLYADEPFSSETMDRYFKRGEVGLYGKSIFQLKPRSFFPQEDMDALIEEFTQRGYDRPITYVPPKTLCAGVDWDEHHVPHVVGQTVEDTTYGLGYATVYTNMFELLFIRFAGTSGILQTGLDISKLDFTNATTLREMMAQTGLINYSRAELMDTLDPKICDEILGEDCQEMAGAMVAYQQGINQAIRRRYPIFKLLEKLNVPWPRWEAVDTAGAGLVAAAIFGDPGADQLANLSLYKKIERVYGEDKAKAIFDDYQLKNAPLDETTVTIKEVFAHPVYADGTDSTDPNRPVDLDSIAWAELDEIENDPIQSSLLKSEKPHASNWLAVSKEKSTSNRPLLVGGPQMKYFRPNLLMEFDARTADNQFQITGVSLPGLFVAAFAGNGHNGAWSPTSAGGKTSDIFIEELCSPDKDLSPSEKSMYYRHDGQCVPMKSRDGYGTPFTVHGPVIAWETVNGKAVAVTRKSNNVERIAQGILPYYALAKGNIKTAADFIDVMQNHSLALNYVFINNSEIGYVITGLYPVRAAGAQMDFPTWGTGQWDWQGVISPHQRPHEIDPQEGFLLSWNNQPAPDFYASDGYYQRVQLLRNLMEDKEKFDLPSLVEISQTAALQDAYAVTLLPLLAEYTQDQPEMKDETMVAMMEELYLWRENDLSKRLDLDRDGIFDAVGPAIMDEIVICLKEKLEDSLGVEIGSLNLPCPTGSSYHSGAANLIRQLLKRAKETGNSIAGVDENLLQCGDGTYQNCRKLVIDALVQANSNLTESFGSASPGSWRGTADKIKLIPLDSKENNGWHWQNRPTFQQATTIN